MADSAECHIREDQFAFLIGEAGREGGGRHNGEGCNLQSLSSLHRVRTRTDSASGMLSLLLGGAVAVLSCTDTRVFM